VAIPQEGIPQQGIPQQGIPQQGIPQAVMLPARIPSLRNSSRGLPQRRTWKVPHGSAKPAADCSCYGLLRRQLAAAAAGFTLVIFNLLLAK
jgi:hypothetical protein